MMSDDLKITQTAAPPKAEEPPVELQGGIEIAQEDNIDFSPQSAAPEPPPAPEPEAAQPEPEAAEEAPAPIPWDALKSQIPSLLGVQPMRQPAPEPMPPPPPPPHWTPPEPDIDLSLLAEKPDEAIKQYGQKIRQQVKDEIRQEQEAERVRQAKFSLVNRVASNFELCEKNYAAQITKNPAMKDPKVASKVSEMIRAAMTVALRPGGDPLSSEAFRNPEFFQDILAIAKEKAGYRGAPASVMPQGARVLSSKAGNGASPTKTPMDPDRARFLYGTLGLTPEEVEENERLGTRGWNR